MVVKMPPHADLTQVTASAVVSDGWCLAGASEINVRVRRLSEVDAAMSKVLGRDLGRDDVDARVHIRWYDAQQTLP
jgi:hypothetical protein